MIDQKLVSTKIINQIKPKQCFVKDVSTDLSTETWGDSLVKTIFVTIYYDFVHDVTILS